MWLVDVSSQTWSVTMKSRKACYGYTITSHSDLGAVAIDVATWIIWSNSFVDLPMKGIAGEIGVSSELASRVRAAHARVQLIEPKRQIHFHLPYARGQEPALWKRVPPSSFDRIFYEERRRSLPESPPDVFRRRYTVLKGAWIREMEKPDDCVRTVRLGPTPGLRSGSGDWDVPTSQSVVDHFGVVNLNGSTSFMSDAIFEVLRPHLDPTAMYVGRLEDLKLRPARRRKMP